MASVLLLATAVGVAPVVTFLLPSTTVEVLVAGGTVRDMAAAVPAERNLSTTVHARLPPAMCPFVWRTADLECKRPRMVASTRGEGDGNDGRVGRDRCRGGAGATAKSERTQSRKHPVRHASRSSVSPPPPPSLPPPRPPFDVVRAICAVVLLVSNRTVAIYCSPPSAPVQHVVHAACVLACSFSAQRSNRFLAQCAEHRMIATPSSFWSLGLTPI